jgi:hypothetical protein
LKWPGLCKLLRVLYPDKDREEEELSRRSHLAYVQYIFGSAVNLDRTEMLKASPRVRDFTIFITGN